MTNTEAKMTKAEEKAHRAAMLRLAHTPRSREELARIHGQRSSSAADAIPSRTVRKQRSRSGRNRAALKDQGVR